MSSATNVRTTKKRATVKRPKDKNAPKPPLTPYLRFGAQQRAADPTISALPVGKQGKVLAEMWAKLAEEAKEEIKKEYNKDRQLYEKELEEYKKTDEYKTFQDTLKSLSNVKEKKSKKQSAYNEYYKEQYGIIAKENKGFEMKDVTAIIVKNWKEIDDETKKIYIDRANKINEANKENKKAESDD
ncbi:High mobility group protein 20A [Nosema granulosis]|uniref:High mobility group protein 20A n=1 Tax=Nosema granulosis TaxID=83296 RepID=A0A9P6H101_9MICR|nr:High mobility group protein 20A [Nosema granulosis]